MFGGVDSDALFGDSGDDRLVGGDGNDQIHGGADSDRVIGAGGSDQIFGDAGNDRVSGGEGNDFLSGDSNTNVASGDDIVSGGAGDDRIDGGLGTDTLTGGTGHDIFGFVFDNELKSAEGTINRDVITDFSQAEGDLIDIHLIDADTATPFDQSFTFIGGDAFTGVAGQLRAAALGANTLIEGDTNGDGTADLEILLQGTAGTHIAASDFLL
jgi:Ca2+-binding RTX toxin-like protein